MTIVKVTYKDILEGARGKCTQCPIALAVKRLISKDIFLEVCSNDIRLDVYDFEGISDWLKIFLPVEAQRFVISFDKGQHVEPFKFEINIPEYYLNHEDTFTTSNG